jgi:hypothetical protein
MTVEAAAYIEVVLTDLVAQLLGEIDTFARRARKARAGDTTDAEKVLASVSNLEVLARQAQSSGARIHPVPPSAEVPAVVRDHLELNDLPREVQSGVEPWLGTGSIAVLVVDPVATGFARGPRLRERAPAPRVFRSSEGDESAVIQRFREQCAAGGPIMPSSMKDYALTDVLHEFLFSAGEEGRVPVVYADGSAGPNITFGGLSVDTSRPIRRTLSLALMSIRHMEMDATTHGSWFRNVDVSRGVPHGDIDADATERSSEQFNQLLRTGEPVEVRLFLTGFVPAVMAFYRSVADVLRSQGGMVRVRPMFYRPQGSGDDYEESTRTWSVR